MTFEKLIFTEANGRSKYQFFNSQLNHIFTETKDSNCFIPYSERSVCNGNYLLKPIVHQTFFYQNYSHKSTRRFARWISFFCRWICLFIQNPFHKENLLNTSIWNNCHYSPVIYFYIVSVIVSIHLWSIFIMSLWLSLQNTCFYTPPFWLRLKCLSGKSESHKKLQINKV